MMSRFLASDLSPAQQLIEEIKCPACQVLATHALFSHILHWCTQYTLPESWQRKRAIALLNPMYLEVATDNEELLIAVRRWPSQQVHQCLDCTGKRDFTIQLDKAQTSLTQLLSSLLELNQREHPAPKRGTETEQT